MNFSDGTITLSGGNLSQNIQGPIQFRPDNHVNNLGSLRVTLSFASQTGIFHGSLADPSTKRSLPVHGVVLQKQNLAAGYFTGNNQSGQVVIQP